VKRWGAARASAPPRPRADVGVHRDLPRRPSSVSARASSGTPRRVRSRWFASSSAARS
jgi:hypothetical protein